MSSFRKNRGKMPTDPVIVNRSGASRRQLKPLPEPHPEPFPPVIAKVLDMSAERDRTVGAVMRPGTLRLDGLITGEVRDLQVRVNSSVPEGQIRIMQPEDSQLSGRMSPEIEEQISRQVVEAMHRQMENAFLLGQATPVTYPTENRRIPTRQRINLIDVDWPARVRQVQVTQRQRFVDPVRAGIRPMDLSSPLRDTTTWHEGFVGQVSFESRSESMSPAMAALVALQQRVVDEGLDEAVQAIEQSQPTTSWLASFIFNPDGIPALCGILDLGNGSFVVAGCSFRNRHLYRPFTTMEYAGAVRSAAAAAVRDFLFNAHREATPGLPSYVSSL